MAGVLQEGDLEEEITREIFDHLVELAALSLGEGEAEYLRRELNGQLTAIHELEAIEVGQDLPITSHGVPYSPRISAGLRRDEIQECEEAGAILRQAPAVEDRYIVVPDIPSEELE